jgi:hypothetical protein
MNEEERIAKEFKNYLDRCYGRLVGTMSLTQKEECQQAFVGGIAFAITLFSDLADEAGGDQKKEDEIFNNVINACLKLTEKTAVARAERLIAPDVSKQ